MNKLTLAILCAFVCALSVQVDASPRCHKLDGYCADCLNEDGCGYCSQGQCEPGTPNGPASGYQCAGEWYFAECPSTASSSSSSSTTTHPSVTPRGTNTRDEPSPTPQQGYDSTVFPSHTPTNNECEKWDSCDSCNYNDCAWCSRGYGQGGYGKCTSRDQGDCEGTYLSFCPSTSTTPVGWGEGCNKARDCPECVQSDYDCDWCYDKFQQLSFCTVGGACSYQKIDECPYYPSPPPLSQTGACRYLDECDSCNDAKGCVWCEKEGGGYDSYGECREEGHCKKGHEFSECGATPESSYQGTSSYPGRGDCYGFHKCGTCLKQEGCAWCADLGYCFSNSDSEYSGYYCPSTYRTFTNPKECN